MNVRAQRNIGSVYTPRDFAQFLTSWAIRSTSDTALDIGAGDGVFVFSAYQRLKNLGASAQAAQEQIYGAEIDRAAYDRFLSLSQRNGLIFPNVHCQDFFALDFPDVDAVIGNPPYVRRIYMQDVDSIRERVTSTNSHVQLPDLSRLTDLYVYFLLHALARLKPGGRCAVITADPWLTVGYGQVLKTYLQSYFHLDCLITLDRRVFEDAQVKPVILLATRLSGSSSVRNSRTTYFVRVKNGLAISVVEKSVRDKTFDLADIGHTVVDQSELSPAHPWSVYFRAPEVCEELAKHPLMTQVSNVAETRIGIQTLAKDFFVLSRERASRLAIEPEYLAPLAQSSRFFSQPTIELNTSSDFLLFYCSKSKEELAGTRALEYILDGEAQTVSVRGKEGVTVTGYHSKKRIQESHRRYWYDLKSSLVRRGYASILIPRLMYRSYTVVWNRAKFVPGELFIEFMPLPLFAVDDEVYLAILSSSVTEIMLRANAQVYGGGTYNINPGQVKKVPIISADLLTPEHCMALKRAYRRYLRDPNHDRAPIDAAVFKILGLSAIQQHMIHRALQDLVLIATSSKKSQVDQSDPFR